VRLVSRAMTQWQTGMGGATGLRYEALPVLRRALGIPVADWGAVFEDLQVMEGEILRLWREKSPRG
jgi:hypothetical protein